MLFVISHRKNLVFLPVSCQFAQRTFHISLLIFTIFMQKEREVFLSLSFQIFSSASAIVITGILISTCVPFSLSRYVTPYFFTEAELQGES